MQVMFDDLVRDAAARTVWAALKADNIQGFIVGGAVRDALLARPVHDIDMAANATPQALNNACKKAGLRTIPTGIDHGTITVIAEGVPIELTSFRRDIKTDGRHAEVVFGGTLAEDAARRDFTINAIYLDENGNIHDPEGGIADTDNQLLRFVGAAEPRIREDYLRILRYFRFLSVYPELEADNVALSAISKTSDGIERLSAERIGHEMRKLLDGQNWAATIALIAQDQRVLAKVGLHDTADPSGFNTFAQKQDVEPDWRRNVAVLTPRSLSEAWRLSNAETRLIEATVKARAQAFLPAISGQLFGEVAATIATPLIAFDQHAALEPHWREEIMRGAHAKFPLTGRDLKGFMPDGPTMGATLHDLRQKWIDSDFTLEREGLLSYLREP